MTPVTPCSSSVCHHVPACNRETNGGLWGIARQQPAIEGLVAGISSGVAPCANRLRISSTESRMSRTIGLPPKTSGRAVMRFEQFGMTHCFHLPVVGERPRQSSPSLSAGCAWRPCRALRFDVPRLRGPFCRSLISSAVVTPGPRVVRARLRQAPHRVERERSVLGVLDADVQVRPRPQRLVCLEVYRDPAGDSYQSVTCRCNRGQGRAARSPRRTDRPRPPLQPCLTASARWPASTRSAPSAACT